MSQYSSQLAPLAVNAVLKVIDPKTATNVDLKDIKIVKKLGLVSALSLRAKQTFFVLFD